MKKTYINPELIVVKIETQGMLALSGGLDTATEITNPEGFGSREFEELDELEDIEEEYDDYGDL